jgi:ATP-dependent Lon protease
MRIVIIPEQNKKDLEDIPPEILKKVKIVAVSKVEDALKLALEKFPPHAPTVAGKKPEKTRPAVPPSGRKASSGAGGSAG